MAHPIKQLGLALLGALALAVAVAPAAVAETEKFHTAQTEGKTVVTGEKVENAVFTGDFGTITCTTVTPEASFLEGAPTPEDLSVKVEYVNCTLAGGKVIHSPNSCVFTMTKPTNVTHTAGPPAVTHAKSATHIVCPLGAAIEFEILATGCTVTIPTQTPTTASTFDLTSQGTPKDILATPKMEGIHYTSDGPFCAGGGATTANGTYKGSMTMKGFDTITGTPVGIWAT